VRGGVHVEGSLNLDFAYAATAVESESRSDTLGGER
jgi:hypothetical protein